VRDPKEELATILVEITALLERHGETYWREWLAGDAQLIRQDDVTGLEHLLSAYGGMGSFTDLVLSPLNGHKITQAEGESVNDRLHALASRAYDIARELQRAA